MQKHEPTKEPDRSTQFYWDTWTLCETGTDKLHFFRLNAPETDHLKGTNHLVSRLAHGVGTSTDDIEYTSLDIIKPDADSSVWSGCAVRRSDGKYLLFYTQRTSVESALGGLNWAHQSIRCAVTASPYQADWERVDSMNLTIDSVDPDGIHFLRETRLGDRTIHAWRDPFVFEYGGSSFMLVAAKSLAASGTPGGCVALLRASDESLLEWTLLNPALVSGFEELEVPQMYIDDTTKEVVLIASTWDEEDYKESARQGVDPRKAVSDGVVRRNGELLLFRAKDFNCALLGEFTQVAVGVRGDEGMYAGVLVPELDGAVIGFDILSGELRRARASFPSLRRMFLGEQNF
jgi:hypothetical protein